MTTMQTPWWHDLTPEQRERANVAITKAICGYGPDDPLWHAYDHVADADTLGQRVAELEGLLREASARLAPSLSSLDVDLSTRIDATLSQKDPTP